MSEQLQLRRGAAAQVAAFTGAQGEVVVDTTNHRLVLQDGATIGGFAAAKLSEIPTLPITVGNGGTGQTSLVAHGLLIGEGTSAVAQIASGSGGTMLQGQGSADPFFTANPMLGVPGAASGSLGLANGAGGATILQPQTPASGTLTLPAATDMLVGRATTDTLSNKTLASATLTGTASGPDGGTWGAGGLNGSAIGLTTPASAAFTAIALARRPVADANFTVGAGISIVAYTAITAARTVTLPPAAGFRAGQQLLVIDESGACSAICSITLAPAGADTIASPGTIPTILTPNGYLAVESNGANAWIVIDSCPMGGAALRSESVTALAGSPALTIKGNVNKERFAIYSPIQPQFDGYAPGTSVDAPSATGAGQILFALGGHGYNGSVYTNVAAAIVMMTTEAWGPANNGAAIRFLVTKNGAVTGSLSGPEAMRIDNTGFVGINTPSPQQPLDVQGAIQTKGAYGSTIRLGLIEDTIACSGASSLSAQQIPSRAIVLSVSVRVAAAITGATGFNVDATTSSGGGAGTAAGQFGSGIAVAAGSTNVGVIGPTAWYAPSTIKLTASGGSFTGGQVRVAIQYLLCGAPTS
jgi:Major tropism determinant N-terminal domain